MNEPPPSSLSLAQARSLNRLTLSYRQSQLLGCSIADRVAPIDGAYRVVERVIDGDTLVMETASVCASSVLTLPKPSTPTNPLNTSAKRLPPSHSGIVKASQTLVRHLDTEHENISIRAAEKIIDFAQKALEHEELEKRIEALEAKAAQNR
jgi:hypothetical protein